MAINDLSQLGKAVTFDTEYIEPKRGEIYMCDLSDMSLGNVFVMQKNRPALVIQNNMGNKFSATVIVALMSASQRKDYPMHYTTTFLNNTESTVMFEQIITIDKTRLKTKMGELTSKQMKEAEEKLMNSLELDRFSLNSVEDIEIINRIQTKTRDEEFISFTIQILFNNDRKLEVSIKLSKLQEYDNSIDENMDFDILKQKLDCCKGLNWLVNNNDI